MNAPVITTVERDDRPCPCCNKLLDAPTTGRSRAETADHEGHDITHAIAFVNGEWRWVHSHCFVNPHLEGVKEVRQIVCTNCGLPLRGDHTVHSAQTIEGYFVPAYAECRDGGCFSVVPCVTQEMAA